ncbi:PLDc N-terminal domain-containing protein [Streptomyces sp. 900105755]
MQHGAPVAALIPLFLIGLGFVGYCLYDIARQRRTRHLPKAAWIVITLISIPLGGIVYLLLGRSSMARGEGIDA